MLIIEHTIETTASPEAVWDIWQDVSHWNTWDHGIEYSSIDGPFATGTTGTLKPKGGPLLQTQLTAVIPMRMFVDESRHPFARIIVSHFMTAFEGKTRVTHRIEMRGVLAYLFSFLIGRTMKKNLPEEMKAMIALAERRSGIS